MRAGDGENDPFLAAGGGPILLMTGIGCSCATHRTIYLQL